MEKIIMSTKSTNFSQDIFPIALCDRKEGSNLVPKKILGTCFLIHPKIILTCAHCLDHTHKDTEVLVALKLTSGGVIGSEITNIGFHQEGLDIAVGNVEFEPTFGFGVETGISDSGIDIFSVGYPLTQIASQQIIGSSQLHTPVFEINLRYLQGYITRKFTNDRPPWGSTNPITIEADMKAPEGHSGAPVFRVNNNGQIVGIVYGEYETYTVIRSAVFDNEGNLTEPEARSIINFACIHPIESALSIRCVATQGKPLSELLEVSE